MADITIKVVEENGGFDNAPAPQSAASSQPAQPPVQTPNQGSGSIPQATPSQQGSQQPSPPANAGTPQRTPVIDLLTRLRNSAIGQRIRNTRAGRRISRGIRAARVAFWRAARSRIGQRIIQSGIGQRIAASRAGQAVGGLLARAGIAGVAARTATAGAGAAATGATGAAAGAAAGGAAGGAAAGGAAGGAAAGAGAAAAGLAVGGPVGLAVGLGIGAAVVAAAAGLQRFNSMTQRAADEIERFSGEISLARSVQSARTQINMMERARVLGPGLGRIEEARGRLNDAMERLWTRILAILIKLEPFFTKVIDGITVIVELFNVLAAKIDEIYARFTLDPNDDKPAQDALNKALTDFQKSLAQFMGQNVPQQNQAGQLDPQFAEFIRLYGAARP